MSTASRASTLPVLLLKTKSAPTDGYAECLAEHGFQPIFVPVLDHRPTVANVEHVRVLLKERSFGRDDSAKYGGLIFTSQRAVEAFAQVVSEIDGLASNVSGEVSDHYRCHLRPLEPRDARLIEKGRSSRLPDRRPFGPKRWNQPACDSVFTFPTVRRWSGNIGCPTIAA